MIEPHRHSVLDSPHARGMTPRVGKERLGKTACVGTTRPIPPIIARSESDEAIQTSAAERLWIASAFAKASADKSLRSQ
jgi:hypothetical protein